MKNPLLACEAFLTRYRRLLRLAIAFSIFITSIDARADFSKVEVKLQTGQVVAIKDLPVFSVLFDLLIRSEHKKWAHVGDWVILAPAKTCPTYFSYWVQWQGSITEDILNRRIQYCSVESTKRIGAVTTEIIQHCQCRIVLRTEKASPNFISSDKALWKSYDDEFLQLDGLNIARTLFSRNKNNDPPTPVVLSLSGKSTGIYSYDGNRLCSLDSQVMHINGLMNQIRSAIERLGDDPFTVPARCIGDRLGSLKG